MRLTHRYILAVCVSITVIVFYVGFILPSKVTIINKRRFNFLRNGLKKIPKLRNVTGYLRDDATNRTVAITHREVRHCDFDGEDNLIDSYGKNDLTKTGEMGRGVIFVGDEKISATKSVEEYRVNVFASDLIPLNRMVPDSRHAQCQYVEYPDGLPSTSIVIPFHNEWPSILLRTVYSIINRTPRNLLKEIILVDDASTLGIIHEELSKHINKKIPKGLVKLVRMNTRVGLIRARLEGFKQVTGEVVSFFDSHMEVNVDWLQPLLVEIQKNHSTVAMAHLDYIRANTFQYDYYEGYHTRYGFDWRLTFYETFFRDDQSDPKRPTAPQDGVVMVGPAFAVNVQYFKDIGMYDEGMKIWGGENLEFAWRVWMCGGKLVHLPCSHVGHIARSQPYSFPDGREATEIYNYKRAIDVWMGDYKKYVHNHYPGMKHIDAGNISDRLAIKNKLNCQDFGWYLKNIWPELLPYGEDVFSWGSLNLKGTNLCLDNHDYLFQGPEAFGVSPCTHQLAMQGFSWTHLRQLRTSLQCVVLDVLDSHTMLVLEDCMMAPKDTWTHMKDGFMRHVPTGLCLGFDGKLLLLESCNNKKTSQKWSFTTYKKSYYDIYENNEHKH